MRHVKPIISAKDTERFIQQLKNYDVKYSYLFMVGVYTGLRVSDILPLRVGDILPKKRRLKIKEQKTGKVRVIPITKELRKMVKAVQASQSLSKSDYIIQGRSKGGSLSRSQAYRVMRETGEKIGIDGIGVHSLRKTYAIALFRKSGGNVEAVRVAMNHKYQDTTLKSYIMSGIDVNNLLKIYSEL